MGGRWKEARLPLPFRSKFHRIWNFDRENGGENFFDIPLEIKNAGNAFSRQTILRKRGGEAFVGMCPVPHQQSRFG
jgi:hypothetical protein